MRMIVALIRPHQVPAVKVALHAAGVHHLTASTAMGTAPHSEQQVFRGVERKVELFPRVRLEVAVGDDQVNDAVDAIIAGSKDTGGHGTIFISKLEEVVMVWNGARGEAVLQADD